MGLTNSLNTGKSALLASQTALQVAGNNLANLGTRGYHRQDVALEPKRSQEIQNGVFIGRGVKVQSITRQVNEALEARLRTAVSDQAGSQARTDALARIESIENEFTDVDLSTRLSEFFNNWSQLANNPQDLSLRNLVTEQAGTISAYVQDVRGDLANLQKQTDDEIASGVNHVNDLLSKVADLNKQIVSAEGGTTSKGASGLRDQRDQYLSELSESLDISTTEQPGGSLDVFVGSLPIVLNGESRGVELRTRTAGDELQIDVVAGDDKSPLQITAGKLGALVDFRKNDLKQSIDGLDEFAHNFIHQVNLVHSQGQGLILPTGVTGTQQVDDPDAALNSDDARLDFPPTNGSFKIRVTQDSSTEQTTAVIDVDLDGIDPDNDTSLNDLAAQLNSVAGVNASVTAGGRLSIRGATSDTKISFADDTAGVLAGLGVNTFFTGKNAHDIAVNPTVKNDGRLIAAARDNLPGDNANALAIADLRDQGVDGLDGQSVTEFWNRHVEDFATRLSQARSATDADAVVKGNLQAQQQAISGVNADEETIDLLQFQRTYQASARFISVVDELLQTLIGLV